MIKKREISFGIGIMLILIIGIFLVSSIENSEGDNLKVSGEVYGAFENQKEIRVNIKLKEIPEIGKFKIALKKQDIKEQIIGEVGEENIIHDFGDSLSIQVSEEELKKLETNSEIISITTPKKIYAFLQDSVPLINATGVWPLQISGINLTGINETICIIDTGIDFTHPALIGKNKTCVIDCIHGCVENCSLGDDNGHGTHVGGIVAASGAINGVAIGANLIGVKVLNSAGSGNGDDLNAGIDWCVSNSELYNISVISMSLGDCTNHSTYCNSDSSASHINSAVAKNISVVVAAGNGNSGSCTGLTLTAGPSSPACVQNATAIGTVDNSDNINFQRGSLFELFAPGISINSTKSTGGYEIRSGTSMATPMVAGAIALIKQYLGLKGLTKTPQEIQNLLNSTGKQIYDSGTGLNFSRIDIYSAIDYLRTTRATMISPLNNSYLNLINQNSTFICNASSENSLTNITFYLWNSTGLVYNLTTNILGTNNQTNFSYNFTIENNYLWNCIAYNNNSFANSNSNYTITYDTTKPQINLISPINASPETSSSTISFTYNVSDVSIANCSLIINNAINETDSSVIINSTETISKSLSNANYNWSINCTDSARNINNSEERTFTLSYTAPVNGNTGGSSGGGGGASIKSMTYIPSISETFSGYTKSLSKDDKIKFTFFDKSAETHTLTINQIGTDYINLTIQSNPINLKLGIGQSAKLNITNSEYYDLYVKLNSITNNKADLTIQTISELISKTPVTGKTIEEIGKDKDINQTGSISYKERFIYAVGLIIIIIAVIILMSKKDKYTENTKKQYKQEFKKYIKPHHKI